ncbi:MAG: hypothetical protein KBT57_08555 [bacterium]|nr:hypothetical protein [Candidatus Limimorpha equi]
MKKLSMICMAALLVMAMSCKKNEEGTNADGKGFRASMEAQTGDSKTHLEGSSVKWDSGDAIRVVNGATPAACFDFTTDAVEKDGCVEFTPSSQDVDDSFFQPSYTAYYPADKYDPETGKVTLPATQTYVKVNKDDSNYDSFGKGCNPMIAKSETEQLSFKHLCGILALPLTGTCTVASIKLTAINNVKLWGEGTVDYSGNDPVLTLDAGSRTGANSITMNCGTDGVTLSATAATTFYFVIPAGVNLGGISVELTDKAGNVWNNSTPAMTMLIERKKVASMAAIAVETHNPNFPIGAIPGRFTINANKDQVCFSRGNLQYQASTNTWRFAEHQYDFVGAQDLFNQINKKVGNVFEDGVQCDNRFTSATYSGWIDLFCWGTSGYNNKYPYMTSTNNYNYGDGDNNISGTEYDWGKHNAISNGGNTPNTWRTLTCLGNGQEEWYYLIYLRPNAGNLWAKGRIISENSTTWTYDIEKDIAGFILLPDSWVKPDGIKFVAGQGSGYLTNSYSPEDWAVMEAAGAVFLPDAGHRYNVDASGNANVYYDGAGYWTSTAYSDENATIFTFGNGGAMHSYNGLPRSDGYSVRLVQDLPKQTP